LHCRKIVEVPIPKIAIFVPMFTDGKEKLKRKIEGVNFSLPKPDMQYPDRENFRGFF